MRRPARKLWRFYTAAASNEPGGDTWAGAPDETRAASTWALPGGYDPVRAADLLGRREPDAQHARQSPRRQLECGSRPSRRSDLYSNSTIALDPDTGKLEWYYQHLPGDDWDEDYAQRADAAAHDARSRSEVREVDQPRRQARRAARRHAS